MASSASFQDRAHFYGMCSVLMRRILVDWARSRGSFRRGGDRRPVRLDEALVVSPESEVDLVALDDALKALEVEDPRKSRAVELRFFGGLSVEDSAKRSKIDWATFQAIQARLDCNTRPQPHQPGGAVREGSALLQGIASCGHCGRRLLTHYQGRNSTPGYHCAGKDIVKGRGEYCLTIGGLAIEQAVANSFLEAITPAAVEATMLSIQQLQSNHSAALSQWRLEVERARYEAEKAERRYRIVEPENRLVARGLETESENRLRDLAAAEAEVRRREQERPNTLSSEQLQHIRIIGSDLRFIWAAATTTDRDRKELLRTLLEEVIFDLKRAEGTAHLTLRWRGGAITILDVAVPRFKPMGPRTDEDTISLLRRLAPFYPDEVIAGVFNRQQTSGSHNYPVANRPSHDGAGP